MTYTRTGMEFPDECANAGISDAAYRTHHEGLSWLNAVERIDCHIPKHLVRRFAGSDCYETAVKDLVASGFWSDGGDVWVVQHSADVTRAGIVAQQNKRTRDKKAQAEARKRRRVSD